jgi:hypothetical protein
MHTVPSTSFTIKSCAKRGYPLSVCALAEFHSARSKSSALRGCFSIPVKPRFAARFPRRPGASFLDPLTVSWTTAPNFCMTVRRTMLNVEPFRSACCYCRIRLAELIMSDRPGYPHIDRTHLPSPSPGRRCKDLAWIAITRNKDFRDSQDIYVPCTRFEDEDGRAHFLIGFRVCDEEVE